jgi:hypothetical protein
MFVNRFHPFVITAQYLKLLMRICNKVWKGHEQWLHDDEFYFFSL